MSNQEWRYVLVLVAAVGLAVAVPWLRPTPVDWTDSFAHDDTRPYGSRALFETLPALFPAADAVQAVPTTPYLQLRDTTTRRTAYLFVTSTLRLDPTETRALLRYAARGNAVFLAAQTYEGPLADSLNLGTELELSIGSPDADDPGGDGFAVPDLDAGETARLRLAASNAGGSAGFPVREEAVRYAFARVDTARTAILGTDGRGRPTLVRTRWGDGRVVLSTTPRVFTNYHVLQDASRPYVAAALSQLPGDRRAVWWDARHKPGAVRDQSVLRFVLSQPSLRTAYWLVLAGALLFVFSRGRRRQRAVPVIEPPRNRTLDFVRRVGQLYYERGQHIDLARKKIRFFLAFVRRRLDLDTAPRDAAWVERVARRAGTPPSTVAALTDAIDAIEGQSALSAAALKRLDDRLDAFYAEAAPRVGAPSPDALPAPETSPEPHALEPHASKADARPQDEPAGTAPS